MLAGKCVVNDARQRRDCEREIGKRGSIDPRFDPIIIANKERETERNISHAASGARLTKTGIHSSPGSAL